MSDSEDEPEQSIMRQEAEKYSKKLSKRGVVRISLSSFIQLCYYYTFRLGISEPHSTFHEGLFVAWII
jgi:hypothetical protein